MKAELERIAEQEGLSLSKTGSSFLEEAIRQKLHIQHAVLLQPIIETTIRQQMSKMMNRFVLVLARIAYEDGQTRRLVTNILSRQPGINAAQLDTILDRSSDEARKHIFRKTPQIHALIQAVETWLQEEDTT